jgi:hypothetical protein
MNAVTLHPRGVSKTGLAPGSFKKSSRIGLMRA